MNQKQLVWLACHLPEPTARTVRPPYPNLILLSGILKVLRSGCRWRDLDAPGFPSGVTHWRRFHLWERRSKFWWLWRHVLRQLYREKKLDLSRAVIDGTLVPSFSFRDKTGYSGKDHQTGTKILSVTEREGIPLAVSLTAGNRHDSPFATPTIKRLKVGSRTRPGIILGDKGFDSAAFRRTLRKRGIKTNIPEREFQTRRKRGRPPTYDRKLGKQRYVVERTNGWLKSFRRIHFRYDYSITSFRAFVLLACSVVCVRQLIT